MQRIKKSTMEFTKPWARKERGQRSFWLIYLCSPVVWWYHMHILAFSNTATEAEPSTMRWKPLRWHTALNRDWSEEESTRLISLMASRYVLTFKFPRVSPPFPILVLSLSDLTADSSSLCPLSSLFLMSEWICMQTLNHLQSTTARAKTKTEKHEHTKH